MLGIGGRCQCATEHKTFIKASRNHVTNGDIQQGLVLWIMISVNVQEAIFIQARAQGNENIFCRLLTLADLDILKSTIFREFSVRTIIY